MRALRLVFLLGPLVAACSDSTGPADPLALLEENVARWNRQGLTDYQYTITRYCECLAESSGPVVVEVRGGEVETRKYLSGTPVDPQYDGIFTTVPGLFDLIRTAIEFPAAAIAVRYDRDYGFPESIQIDWVAGAVDDEVSYRVTDFAPLPPR